VGGPLGRIDDGFGDGFDDDGEDEVALVRPYSRTGGRTRSSFDLAIEALVSSTELASGPTVDPEHQPIAELCAEVRSVAEVAALLSMPLGVARILLADMAEQGLVQVHRTAHHLGSGNPPIGILERVLAGLRRL
jgi:hypothetical protein